jgi:hypothetical protein
MHQKYIVICCFLYLSDVAEFITDRQANKAGLAGTRMAQVEQ